MISKTWNHDRRMYHFERTHKGLPFEEKNPWPERLAWIACFVIYLLTMGMLLWA